MSGEGLREGSILASAETGGNDSLEEALPVFPFATWRGASPLHRQEITGLKAFGQESQLVRSGQSILISQGMGEGQWPGKRRVREMTCS